MSEQSAMQVLRQLRRMSLSVLCALPICSIPAAAFAQSVPPALRACAAETDAGQRLDCYDREMARLLALPKQPATGAVQPDAPSSAAAAQSPRSAAAPRSRWAPSSVPSSAPAPSSTPAHESPAAVAQSGDTEPASREISAPRKASRWKIFTGGGSPPVAAHIVRLDRSPDAMVLHLDNGQVWQQIGRASGDLGLQAGDSVRIEKHLGSYWLSSRHVSDMQVRLEPSQIQ